MPLLTLARFSGNAAGETLAGTSADEIFDGESGDAPLLGRERREKRRGLGAQGLFRRVSPMKVGCHDAGRRRWRRPKLPCVNGDHQHDHGERRSEL